MPSRGRGSIFQVFDSIVVLFKVYKVNRCHSEIPEKSFVGFGGEGRMCSVRHVREWPHVSSWGRVCHGPGNLNICSIHYLVVLAKRA